MTDAEIVWRVRNGHTEDYTLLVERYRNAIYGLAYHHLQNFEDARDVAQEAFIQAYLNLHQLREPDRFAGWLRQVTTNQCRMWQRQHHATEPLEADAPLSHLPVSPDLAQLETRLSLQQALTCLSEDSRLTLILFYLQQHSIAEISQFLEVPATTIKSRLRNARTRLQKEMLDMVEETLQTAPLTADFATQIMQMLNTSDVLAVAFAPDGKLLATGSRDRNVKLWDAQTGQLMRVGTGHLRPVDALTFAPDGHLLATGSRDRTVKLWDIPTCELRTTLNHQGRVDSLSFSRTGETLATVNARREESGENVTFTSQVLLWKVATGDLIREIETLKCYWQIEAAPGTPGASGGLFYAVAFAPQGNLLATSNALTENNDFIGAEVKCWDAQSGALLQTITVPDFWIKSIAFSPDGSTLAGGCMISEAKGQSSKILAGEVRFWSVATGALLHTFKEEPLSGVHGVTFSPDGSLIAVGRSRNDGAPLATHDVRLWSMKTGKLLQTLHEDNKFNSAISFSPDGTTLARGYADGTVGLWRING